MASAYVPRLLTTQCLNLENRGLSPGCAQEQDRDETLGGAKLIFKTGDKIQSDDNYILK